jgi:hypothetical protein
MSEMTIQRWEWDHLVQPRYGKRRQREFVAVELRPEGWPASTRRQQLCHSMTLGWINGEPIGGTLSRDEFRQFHGLDDSGSPPTIPTIWKVTHGPKGRRHVSYYCDAHLPGEFRKPTQPTF